MNQALHLPGFARRQAWRAVRAVILCLGLCSSPAWALMLGQPQGVLMLGQPLHLRIPVRMDPGLPLVAECVRARVLDGSAELPGHALHLTVADADARTSFIELRSTQALRTPFVQLEVSMQCQFGLRRQYTLLVDPPAAGAPEQVLPRPVEEATSRARTRPAASAAAAAAATPATGARQARRRHPAAGPARHATNPRRATPRLHMQWLAAELAGARAPASANAGGPPVPGASRVAGSAPLQQAPSRLDQRVDALQARVAAEQQRTAQQERELALLRTRLAHARMGTPWWWNAALAALSALCVLLGVLLWQRRPTRTPSSWFAADASPSPRPGSSARSSVPALELPSDFAVSSPRPGASGFHASAFQRPLSAPEQVQIDEVVDHGHLADFFIGIGDYDKAIDVMRRALAESGGALSAMPYLYLFDLYRRSGRRDDYEQLRDECGARLNARIPPWDEDPVQAERDLLDYPRALALLVAVWATPSCLTVIERMIADDPQAPRAGFDLPAYRDLLDLYALARDLQRAPSEAPAAPPDALLDLDLALTPAAPSEATHSEGAPAPRGRRSRLLADEPPTLPPLEFAPDPR